MTKTAVIMTAVLHYIASKHNLNTCPINIITFLMQTVL